jgi:ABC-type bacteriocin/lantibiotic exporter with double-glycine peptidase domain
MRHIFSITTALSLWACQPPSYRLPLYEGAERLADGPLFEHQKDRTDCGVAAAVMMLRLTGRKADYQTLRRQAHVTRDGLSLSEMRQLMRVNALSVRGLQVDPASLEGASLPLIAWLPTRHVIVIERVTPTSAFVSDPGYGRWKVSRAKLARAWDGTALVPLNTEVVFPHDRMRSDTARSQSTRGLGS